MITGSIGMIPSSSLGDGTRGLYEPIHGSAPDIAGKDIVNPTACILSAAMMLRYSFGMAAEADAIENAVSRVLDKGLRTADNMSDGCTCLAAPPWAMPFWQSFKPQRIIIQRNKPEGLPTSGLEFFILLQHLGEEGFQAGVLGVREQFLRRLILLNLAIVDEDDPVGHLTGKAHFVGDHQHGDAGVCQLLHQLQHLAHHLGVKGAGGLVEQDHVRSIASARAMAMRCC